VLDCDQGEGIVEAAGRQRDVVAHGPALLDHLDRRGDPTDSQTREAERLGDRTDADPVVAEISDRRRQRLTAGQFEPAIRSSHNTVAPTSLAKS
jgi:hypothetical protein